jgi:hypothetical protein
MIKKGMKVKILTGKDKSKEGEEVKYPHKMYDPKTGKEVTAKTPEDHEKYNKMDQTHARNKAYYSFIKIFKLKT